MKTIANRLLHGGEENPRTLPPPISGSQYAFSSVARHRGGGQSVEYACQQVEKDGLALQNVPPRLQNEGIVVEKAISQNGLALEYASKRFKSNRELVAMALANNIAAFEHIDKSLKDILTATGAMIRVGRARVLCEGGTILQYVELRNALKLPQLEPVRAKIIEEDSDYLRVKVLRRGGIGYYGKSVNYAREVEGKFFVDKKTGAVYVSCKDRGKKTSAESPAESSGKEMVGRWINKDSSILFSMLFIMLIFFRLIMPSIRVLLLL